MRRLFALVIALLLIAGCSSASADPVSFDGVWQSVEKPNDMFRFSAIVADGVIEINIIDENSRALYWVGTAPETISSGDIFVSEADQEILGNALLGSLDSTKEFTYANEELTFEGGMMGVLQDFTLRKVR